MQTRRAKEVEALAVEVGGAGLRDGADYSSARSAVLGGVRVRQNLELLHGCERHLLLRRVGEDEVVVAVAVEFELREAI